MLLALVLLSNYRRMSFLYMNSDNFISWASIFFPLLSFFYVFSVFCLLFFFQLYTRFVSSAIFVFYSFLYIFLNAPSVFISYKRHLGIPRGISFFFFNFFFWYVKFLCRNIFLFCLNFLDSFSLHTFELYHPQYYNNCFLKRKKQTKTNNNGINYVYRDAPRYCHLKDYLRKEQTMKYILGKESIVKSPRNLLLFSEKDSKSMI